MSAIRKPIINRDHADKKWLLEDFESHWTEPVKATSTSWLVFSAILLTIILALISIEGL